MKRIALLFLVFSLVLCSSIVYASSTVVFDNDDKELVVTFVAGDTWEDLVAEAFKTVDDDERLDDALNRAPGTAPKNPAFVESLSFSGPLDAEAWAFIAIMLGDAVATSTAVVDIVTTSAIPSGIMSGAWPPNPIFDWEQIWDTLEARVSGGVTLDITFSNVKGYNANTHALARDVFAEKGIFVNSLTLENSYFTFPEGMELGALTAGLNSTIAFDLAGVADDGEILSVTGTASITNAGIDFRGMSSSQVGYTVKLVNADTLSVTEPEPGNRNRTGGYVFELSVDDNNLFADVLSYTPPSPGPNPNPEPDPNPNPDPNPDPTPGPVTPIDPGESVDLPGIDDGKIEIPGGGKGEISSDGVITVEGGGVAVITLPEAKIEVPSGTRVNPVTGEITLPSGGTVTTSINIKIELPRNASIRHESSQTADSSVRANAVRTIYVGSSGKAKVTYADGSIKNVSEDSRILLLSDGKIRIEESGNKSSGGCDSGFGAFALILAGAALLRRRVS